MSATWLLAALALIAVWTVLAAYIGTAVGRVIARADEEES